MAVEQLLRLSLKLVEIFYFGIKIFFFESKLMSDIQISKLP